MVSFRTLLLAGTALLASVSGLPTASVHTARAPAARAQVCGVESPAGIVSPANGTTITYSAEEQNNYEGTTFEIIYCSSQYFKTSSLNTSTWLSSSSGAPTGNDDSYYAQALALGTPPDPDAAPAGYYGYRYNVTVGPISGNYEVGVMALTVYEVETGYYNANNIETHTIFLNFQKANTTSS